MIFSTVNSDVALALGTGELISPTLQLKTLYHEFHDTRRLPNCLARRASAPPLIYPHDRWPTASVRLLIVGQGFPAFNIPRFRPDLILPLLPSAFTVAILAAVESLLSAVVSDSMTGDRHNSNVELVAQGVANLVAPMFGGVPVTGAIARTATNFRSGARTPVSGIVHALTLLGIVLVFAPLARFIPLATLVAVLFVVAYNMGEWREIGGILRLQMADKSVWFITFALTVVADLTVAVEVGMGLASLLYIYRISQTTTVATVTPEYIEEGRKHILQDKEFPAYYYCVINGARSKRGSRGDVEAGLWQS
jgi:SulP family sulfate permease